MIPFIDSIKRAPVCASNTAEVISMNAVECWKGEILCKMVRIGFSTDGKMDGREWDDFVSKDWRC